jgi:cytochrome c
MKDSGYEHAHSSPIKTPQQLAVVLVLAFAIPVIGIILLTQFIVSDRAVDPATLAPEAVAARIAPVARVELGEPGSAPVKSAPPAAAASPAAAAPPVQAAAAPAAAAPAAAGANPEQLLQKFGCLACHAVDKKVIGPSYKEVAAKYAGDKNALEALEKKVKAGGAGVWGQIPMPPHPQIGDADLEAMVKYILAQK